MSLHLTFLAIEKRKAILSYDMLGKTLAYSPYVSRFDLSILNDKSTKSIKRIIPDKDFKFLDGDTSDFFALMLDLANLKNDENNIFANLESISFARRYSKALIIHKDIFVDSYQILESALYGSDMIMIDIKYLLQNELSELIEFAKRLRLEPIVEIRNKTDLTKAIFSKANILYIDKAYIDALLSLIPQNKIIFSNGINIDSYDMALI